jgi:ParB/RepB/Spo0J family partition protein
MKLKADVIQVPIERQRQAFNQKRLEELQDSIERLGLIQPLVVRHDEVTSFWTLVAGERRLRAIKLIIAQHPEHTFAFDGIPCVDYAVLDPDKLFEVEAAENLQRDDLTWQEKAKVLARLHLIRQKERPQYEIQPKAETAEEARVTPQAVDDALLLASHLEDPEVAAAKTAKEGVQILRKRAEAAHKVTLLKTFDLSKSPHSVIRGDSRLVAPNLPDASFDCIITDAPYGINADGFGDQAGTGHDYDDSPEAFKALVKEIAPHLERVAKPNAFLYWFFDIRHWDFLNLEFTLAGWKVWHRPLIWDKVGSGMVPSPEFGPRNSYECILYAWRGNRQVLRKAAPDVISYAPPKRLLHGAQKPVELLVDLLTRVVLPGERILDLFAGSGTALVAANRLRLTATVVEANEEQFNNCQLRQNEKEMDDRAMEPPVTDELDIS